MNHYIIQQKINTISDLSILAEGVSVPMIIDGMQFSQWDFNLAEGCIGNAWIAEYQEEAENYHGAVLNFRKRLSKIVPKIAFISQCYMDYTSESFLVYKINENVDKTAFIYRTTNRGAPGLMFMEEEKENFDNLNLENDEFFWYMNDCYNTTGYTAKLLLMFAALESLAGKEVKIDAEGKEYETYNKVNMKAILGNDLFNEIYGLRGLRHKLTHGEYIDEIFSGKNYVEVLHNLILEYMNKNFSVKLNTSVVHPQRHPFGNAYVTRTFIKPKEGHNIEMTLKNVLADFETGDAINNQTLANFDFVFNNDLDRNY